MNKNKILLAGFLAGSCLISHADYQIRYRLHDINFVQNDSETVPIEKTTPKIDSFDSSENTLELNDSFLLSWAVTNALHVYIKGSNDRSGLSDEYREVAGDTLTITPSIDGNYQYTLKVISSDNISIEKTLNITVTPYNYPAPIIASFDAQATTVFMNNPLILSWDVTNFEKIEIKSDIANSGVSTSYNPTNTTSQTVVPTKEGTYNYSLKATNLDKEEAEKTLAIVVEKDPVIENLIANPVRFRIGTSTQLTFEGSEGITYFINNGSNPISSSPYNYTPPEIGVKTVTLTGSKTLNGVTRKAEKTVQIEVVPKDFQLSKVINTGSTDQYTSNGPFTFSSTVINPGEGSVSAIGFAVANYKNTLNYDMTMTACAGSNCVTSPTYNTLTMKDNLMHLFSFTTPLKVGKNENVKYTINMVDIGKDVKHPVFYTYTNPPASISSYVTPLLKDNVSTGKYTDVIVNYQ